MRNAETVLGVLRERGRRRVGDAQPFCIYWFNFGIISKGLLHPTGHDSIICRYFNSIFYLSSYIIIDNSYYS